MNEQKRHQATSDPGSGYLRIGELAKRTGVSPELLRAWEQRYGLGLGVDASTNGRGLAKPARAHVRNVSSWPAAEWPPQGLGTAP